MQHQTPDRLTGFAGELTKAQVRKALEIAADSGFTVSDDPAFVGAVINAMAINVQTVELKAAITAAAPR